MDARQKKTLEIRLDNSGNAARANLNKPDTAAARAKKPSRKKRMVVLKCSVSCSQYFPGDIKSAGEQLKLIRIPDNDEDRWTTRVCTSSGTKLGYLPANKNQSVARLMDAGKNITAFVDKMPKPAESPLNKRSQPNMMLPVVLYMDVNIPEEENK